jgi:hypothetical protein
MPTATTVKTTRWEDWATPVSLAVGLAATMAALVALIVAGVTVADTFTPNASDTVSDTGVWAASRMWATALAQLGVAVIFGAAIVSALSGVRARLDERRQAFVEHLPGLVLARTTR